MNIKSRLERIEAELEASYQFPWNIIVIKDHEEYLRFSVQGPDKIVVTESEVEARRARVEKAKAEGLM